MFIYKVIVFDDNLNHNIVLFNEDLDKAVQYANEHDKKVGGYKKAFAVKCLKDKINLITFFKEGPFIDYVRNDEFDKNDINTVNHIISQTCLPLIHVIA